MATALVGLFNFLTINAEAKNSCRASLKSEEVSGELLTKNYYERDKINPESDYFHPRSFLAEKSKKDILGLVETEFSEKYDTRFYYTATSEKTNKDIPFVIDPKSKAVYIFFHGSGTAQSSGKNFYGIMNNLAKLGFSALSFDYPFHGDGPLSPKFNDVEYFMKWVDSIVQEAKKSGKPIYLVGHSFGPDVISEYVTRFPFAVAGALLMSPAGFNPILSAWYDDHTSKMKFGGEVPQNEAGGIWASQMSLQFLWNKFKLQDPTLVNPNLKIRVLSGNREEYVPAPTGGSKKTPIGPNTYDIGAAIREHFRNIEVIIEDGVGHYIFTHTDAKGNNVVMRELLEVAGFNIGSTKKMIDETSLASSQTSYADRLIVRYSLDGNFRTFVNRYVGERSFKQKMKNNNEVLAKHISDQYDLYARAYELKIAEYVVSDSPYVKDFQKSNLALVESARKNMKERFSQVLVLFSAYLETKTPAQIEQIVSGFHYEHPAQLVNLVK